MATVGFFNAQGDSIAQLDAFNNEQCEHIYHDERSLFEGTQPGDVVVFSDLSAAGEGLEDALALVHRLKEHELGFVFVKDGLDSRSSEDLGNVMDAMYNLVKTERKRQVHTGAGSSEGSSRRGGGRRPRISPEVIDEALSRYAQGETVHSLCEEYGFSQGTIYRYIRERGITRNNKEEEAEQ